MKVTYNFANGENITLLVDEKLGDAIMQLDKDLYNNNQKETRRYKSLSELLDKTSMLVDENVNIEDNFLRQNDVDKLRKAMSKLKPSEQELIHKLYLSEHPMTQNQYSKMLGTTENAIQLRLAKIKRKLKNYI